MEVILKDNEHNIGRVTIDMDDYTEVYRGQIYVDEYVKTVRTPKPVNAGTREINEYLIIIDAKKKLNITIDALLAEGAIILNDGEDGYIFSDSTLTTLAYYGIGYATGLFRDDNDLTYDYNGINVIPFGLKFRATDYAVSVNIPYNSNLLLGNDDLPGALEYYGVGSFLVEDEKAVEVYATWFSSGDFVAMKTAGSAVDIYLGAVGEACMADVRIYSKNVVEGSAL